MKRQEFFAKEGPVLKGALHCHTTISDGDFSPEELMRRYREKGFDFVSITDHKIYNLKNFAPETGLTVIPGMEFDTRFEVDYGRRWFHTVCLGDVEGNGFTQGQVLETAEMPDAGDYQTFLDYAHGKNNMTIFCHPEWSNTPAPYIAAQKGNIAMEIWNSASAIHGDEDKNAAYWDDVLGMGVKIWGVASDDCHEPEDLGVGWVMVRSENTVPAILSALEKGEFYSSCGPEIYDFHVEGNKAYIKCSPAACIRMESDKHPNKILRAKPGESVTEFELVMEGWPGPYAYIRATVIDAEGKQAWTNPIFLAEDFFK